LIPILALTLAAGALVWGLARSDYWWRNPLAGAQFTQLTDFPSAEGDAGISRDGKFVAFLSDRDGPFDAWVGQIGTGQFNNLTEGSVSDMRNPEVRGPVFSPDGALITFWTGTPRTSVSAVPTMGGAVRPYSDAAELDWSPDGMRMISETTLEEAAASRVVLPTVRGLSPRLVRDYMVYLSSRGGDDGVWKFADGTAVELWSGALGRVLASPAISPDGRLIAFTPRKAGRTRLYVMNADGTTVREIGGSLDVRGSAAWSPDGRWVTVGAIAGPGMRLFKVPADGGSPIPMTDQQAMDPVWSPDGRFLVFSLRGSGPTDRLGAITAEGKPHALPELNLPRSSRFVFLPGRPVLLVLKGELWLKNFWRIDLNSGEQRKLTNFSRDFLISDFDVSPDGKEIVFGRLRDNSNVVLIDLPSR
jgi:Tol biopolymer transport system component